MCKAKYEIESGSFTAVRWNWSVIVFALLASLYFNQLVFQWNHECKLCKLEYLLNGTALKPFQYRVLIPWLIQGISSVINLAEHTRTICQWINFFFLFAFIMAFQYWADITIGNKKTSLLAVLIILYMMPFHYLLLRQGNLWYPWDMSTLFLFTLGLIALYQEKWRLFYPLLAVATLNKETTCFLILIFFYVEIGRLNWKQMAMHVSTGTAVWLAVKLALYLYFQNGTSGALFENKLRSNLQFIATLPNLLSVFSLFGFLWLPVLIYFHRIKNPFIQRALLTTPIFFLGMLFVGNIFELRVFSEMIPLIGIAALWIINDSFMTKDS
ncbi:MAG: hypothetical protein BWY83_01614 [bacterium ADurb.Bin478]|nr:MAG: hypothetical protein BWY83_01614 [bacterium ADurb.Bin478]